MMFAVTCMDIPVPLLFFEDVLYIYIYYSITIICTSCTSAQMTRNAYYPIAVGWLSIKPCLS